MLYSNKVLLHAIDTTNELVLLIVLILDCTGVYNTVYNYTFHSFMFVSNILVIILAYIVVIILSSCDNPI